MIKSISITNYRGDNLDIDLRNPWLSGFAVMNIDGLNPVSSNVNMTELSTMDGSVYNSSRLKNRNIVLRLALVKDFTIEQARHILYRYFPLKKEVKITITTDERSVYTTGYVEHNTVDIFSNFETASISILCPDPYLYSVEDVITPLYEVSGGFEFPFSNEVNTFTLKFGENMPSQSIEIEYDGETEVGVEFYIHALGEFQNLRLYSVTTDQEIYIDTSKIELITGSPIASGDDIYINTIPGHKQITLTRQGTVYNILSSISKDTGWIKFEPGINEIVYEGTGIQNSRINIVNRVVYEGV